MKHGTERNRRRESTVVREEFKIPGGTVIVAYEGKLETVSERFCVVCDEWVKVGGLLGAILCPVCASEWRADEGELVLKSVIREWMEDNFDPRLHANPTTGEVYAVRLAEDATVHFCKSVDEFDVWTTDDTHPVWDAAIEFAWSYEAEHLSDS